MKRRKTPIWERTEPEYTYIPYKDSKGNVLGAEDIHFMTEEAYNEKFIRQQNFAVWGNPNNKQKTKNYYTISSPGIKKQCSSRGSFPESLIGPNGEILNVKVSSSSHERLPVFAGSTEVADIILIGAPSVGKTVYMTQMLDPVVHSLLAEKAEICMQECLFSGSDSSASEVYEEIMLKRKDGVCPGPTVYAPDTFMPASFYVTYSDEDHYTHRAVLRFHDIDGEQALNFSYKNTLLNFDYIFLMIGADELNNNGDRSNGQYKKILNRLLQSAAIKGNLNSIKMTVIVSKADLLMNEFGNSALKTLTNTIEVRDGSLFPKDRDGFCYQGFFKHQAVVRQWFKENHPAFYFMLMNNIDESNINFCMVASLGAPTEKNRITEYKPFCIDLPVLKLLADLGVAKICQEENDESRPYEEPIAGLGGSKAAEAAKRVFAKVRKKLSVVDDDDEEFEEEEDYE